MNKRKNLLIVLGEWWEQQSQSCLTKPDKPSSRSHRFLHWLTPNGGTLLLIAVLILTQNVWARTMQSTANAPGPSATTVNYQGRLADSGGTPLDETLGMSFSLWDADTGGSLVWGPESHAAVPVSEGLFSVGLGSQTGGGIPTTTWNGDRYLEITVGGETLSPRELIRSVPIAGMALTVPDGSVESSDLDLDYGTVCLSGHVQVSLPGDYQSVDVPGLSLDFYLEKPSTVLVWIDGLARFNQPSGNREVSVALLVDGSEASMTFDQNDNVWFNVEGQRILALDSGTHTLSVTGLSYQAGTLIVHGVSGYQTCINYLTLGKQ